MAKLTKELAGLIRDGLATARDLADVPIEEIVAAKSDEDHVHRRFVVAAKGYSIDTEKRLVTGVPHSTERVDRHGDIIRVKGWDLDQYKENPVILFGHDSSALPIAVGKKVRAGQSATGLRALLIDEEYHEEELNPQAEVVWRMVAAGKLPGRSVGFRPIKAHRPETQEERDKLGLGPWGVVYEAQELMESSVVTIPANPDALQGRSFGDACKQELERLLGEEVRAGRLDERTARAALGERTVQVVVPEIRSSDAAPEIRSSENVMPTVSPALLESLAATARTLSETVEAQAAEIERLNLIIDEGRYARGSTVSERRGGEQPSDISLVEELFSRIERQRHALQLEASIRARCKTALFGKE